MSEKAKNNNTGKKKRKYKKIYSKKTFISEMRNAESEEEEITAANKFIKKYPDQITIAKSIYDNVEKFIDQDHFTEGQIKGVYQTCPVNECELGIFYRLGRIIHKLPPITIKERGLEVIAEKYENSGKAKPKTKNGRRYPPKTDLQKRVSSAMFRGSSSGGYGSNPLPPRYSDPKS
jgi:hypothetical protein